MPVFMKIDFSLMLKNFTFALRLYFIEKKTWLTTRKVVPSPHQLKNKELKTNKNAIFQLQNLNKKTF